MTGDLTPERSGSRLPIRSRFLHSGLSVLDPKRSFGRVGETDGRLPLSRHSSPPVAAQGVPTAVIRNPHKGVCVTAFSILGEVPQILRLTQVRDRAPAAGTLETIALFE